MTKPKHPTIAMSPVKSSQVAEVGYDQATRTMAVRFKHGNTLYHYSDVPPEKHAALLKAESIGAHLGKHIKGAHAYQKIVAD